MPVKKKIKKYKSKTAPAGAHHFQLWMVHELSKRVTRFMDNENYRRDLIGSGNKLHLYEVAPMLIEHGLSFIDHGVYMPADKTEQLMANPKIAKAYEKLQADMAEFHTLLEAELTLVVTTQ